MDKIEIYTDGSCPRTSKNSYGGWAAHIENLTTKEITVIHGANLNATNNSMELMGIYKSLKLLDAPSKVSIYSDSKYCVSGINAWMHNWKSNNWSQTSTGTEIKNLELWKNIYDLCKPHKVSAHWVPGHKGIMKNELCDLLASKSPIQTRFPPIDPIYPEIRLYARTFGKKHVLWSLFSSLPGRELDVTFGEFHEQDNYKKTLEFADILHNYYSINGLESFDRVYFVFRFFNLHELIYNKTSHIEDSIKKLGKEKQKKKALTDEEVLNKKINILRKYEPLGNIVTIPGNYFINIIKKELNLSTYVENYQAQKPNLCLYPRSPRSRRGV